MFRKRDKDGLPEARVVGGFAKQAPDAPALVESVSDDGENDSGDELASLIPMLFLVGIIVLILYGASR